MAREPVEIRLLGPFQVSVAGRRVALSSGRLRALLATLALSAGRPVAVDRLVDAVWGEELPEDARSALQVYVTRLRGALGTDAITTEPAGYVLRTVPDNIDALRFLRLVERSVEEPTVERALLVEALGLWRGDAFEGVGSRQLIRTERTRLDESRLTAMERRVDLDLAAGRAADVVGELHELATRHPLREPLWARLLIALERSGRQAEALEQYETVRARISDELGADPGGQLQQIHADLLAGVPPGSVEVEASSRTTSVVPRQLPTDLSSFTGRTEVLELLDGVLTARDASSGPKVVVHGTGGVGKTTLAVHWAHRVVDHFPDGQLYLNLRGYGPGEPMSPAAALDALLRGLGIPGDQIPDEVDARGSLLRSSLADRAALLILDNARRADQVRPLLPGSGPSMVVVTSRSQLRGLVVREGADRIGVDEFDRPESIELLAAALGSRAVAYERSELAELAQLCGDLPLALAVAAERASLDADTGLADLVADLRAERDRLDVLDLGDEASDLRAVFAWSYRALDVDTARLFRLLGLHPGPDIGLPAAAALAGVTVKGRRLLDRLVDANLLQQRRTDRYELHDLLHAYAAELADQHDPPADRTVAQDRLYGWYLHSAANARQALAVRAPVVDPGEPPPDIDPMSFADHGAARAWAETERGSLLAVGVALAHSDRRRQTYAFTSAIWRFLKYDRAFDNMLRLGSAAMDAARFEGDDAAEAYCAYLLGSVHAERMEYPDARRLLEHALELFGRQGGGPIHARVLDNLGMLSQIQGELEQAVDCFERSIAMSRQTGDADNELNPMNNLAAVYVELGRFADAEQLSAESAERCRQLGDADMEAAVLDTLGQAQAAQGRHADAIVSYRRSVQLFDELQDPWLKGIALTNLGRALAANEEPGMARDSWREALDLFDAVGSPDGHGFKRDDLVELLATVERPG